MSLWMGTPPIAWGYIIWGNVLLWICWSDNWAIPVYEYVKGWCANGQPTVQYSSRSPISKQKVCACSVEARLCKKSYTTTWNAAKRQLRRKMNRASVLVMSESFLSPSLVVLFLNTGMRPDRRTHIPRGPLFWRDRLKPLRAAEQRPPWLLWLLISQQPTASPWWASHFMELGQP